MPLHLDAWDHSEQCHEAAGGLRYLREQSFLSAYAAVARLFDITLGWAQAQAREKDGS